MNVGGRLRCQPFDDVVGKVRRRSNTHRTACAHSQSVKMAEKRVDVHCEFLAENTVQVAVLSTDCSLLRRAETHANITLVTFRLP